MTDRQTLHQLIEELPASQLVAAENSLTYYRQKEVRRTLELLARELPLYDTDFYAWAQQQAAALRATDWAALDVEHLAEEVEDLRKTERRAVRSQLRLILSHLLKWAYQPARRSEPGARSSERRALLGASGRGGSAKRAGGWISTVTPLYFPNNAFGNGP